MGHGIAVQVVFTPNAYALEVPGDDNGDRGPLTDDAHETVARWLEGRELPGNVGYIEKRTEANHNHTFVYTDEGWKQVYPGSVLVVFMGQLHVMGQRAFGLLRNGR